MINDNHTSERVVALEAQMSANRDVIREHVRDCLDVRRRNEATLTEISQDVKSLLDSASQAKGRSIANRTIFAGLPGAFWQAVMQLLSAGVVATLAVLAAKGKI